MRTDAAAPCPVYTRRDFNGFFVAKYRRLIQAAFDKSEKRPDYRDPAVIEAIAEGYRNLPRPAALPPHPIPRHIFMLWQQGWDAAPPLVRACADSWARHNPDWTLHLLDEQSLAGQAPTLGAFRQPKSGRPARSNIARLALLKAHGGVWADATLFCTRPLDDWLAHAGQEGFFMFAAPRPYRYSDIWFIAAAAQTPVIAAWHEIVRQYWDHFRRPHHYYWMEYLFELLAARDPEVERTWGGVPKLSALGPLAVGGNPFDTAAPAAIARLIAENGVPAHKLSHKWRHDAPLAGTPLGLLTGMQRL